MLAQIIAIVMMATALLGGGGAAAVYASQESLPGETLYPLKTWSEDMRIDISTDAETDLQLNLQFAERRMAEIAAMAGHDDDHAAQAVLRLQNHLNQALEATGQVSQEQALPAMQRVRQTLQTQQSLMQQLMGNPDPAAAPVMTQSRQMFQQQLHVMENQLVEEQEQLQNQLQNQQQFGQQGQQGQQNQIQQQELADPQEPNLMQNQVQNQTNQADVGQPMNQKRLRITLTPGVTPDALQLQQGKGQGFGQAVQETAPPQ